MSWHGTLHEIGFVVTTLSWAAACLVLRSHFADRGDQGWKRGCAAVVLMVVVLSAWPHPDSFIIRTLIATAVQFSFLAALAMRLQPGSTDTASTPTPGSTQ